MIISVSKELYLRNYICNICNSLEVAEQENGDSRDERGKVAPQPDDDLRQTPETATNQTSTGNETLPSDPASTNFSEQGL